MLCVNTVFVGFYKLRQVKIISVVIDSMPQMLLLLFHLTLNIELSLVYINSLVYFSCGAHVSDTVLATFLFQLCCINY